MLTISGAVRKLCIVTILLRDVSSAQPQRARPKFCGIDGWSSLANKPMKDVYPALDGMY